MEFKLKYDSTEERFETLKQIEAYVQGKAKTPEEQEKLRDDLIQKKPDIFYGIYHGYQMSPSGKKELENIANLCMDRLVLNSDLTNDILTFQGKTLEEKATLCAKIVHWLSRDSGISPFHDGNAQTQFEVGQSETEGLNGYQAELSHSSIGMKRVIWMNQKNLEDANMPDEIMRTLFHEALHSTQQTGDASFEELSRKYYVSSKLENPKSEAYNPKWVGKAYSAYFNQPCEEEARFFGGFIQNFIKEDELSHNQPLIVPEIQRVARTLTGNSDCTWKQEYGRLQIQFKDKIKSSYTPQKLAQHLGYVPDIIKRNSIDIPLAMNTDCATIFKKIRQSLTTLSQDTKSHQGGLSGYLHQTQQQTGNPIPQQTNSQDNSLLQTARNKRGSEY